MFRTFTLALLLSFGCFSCQNSPTTAENPDVETPNVEQQEQQPNESIMTEVVFNDSIDLPAGWTVVGEASGDLNKDELAERVLIVQTAEASEDITPERRIRIYQRGHEAWSLWQEVAGGVLPADAGGMLGDPFQEVSIERLCIVLTHFGGSRIRWNYTHRYRWQNETWEMIGATVVYGAPCDYWHEFDYNLSTGKVVGKIETEDCEKDSSTTEDFEFMHQIRPLPTMEKYEPGTTAVAVPGRDLTFYF